MTPSDSKSTTPNSTYPKDGVSCSKDSFVVNQTLVFQIKFSAENPAFAKRQNVIRNRLTFSLRVWGTSKKQK